MGTGPSETKGKAAAKRKATVDTKKIIAEVKTIAADMSRKIDEGKAEIVEHVDAVGAKVDKLKFSKKRKSKYSDAAVAIGDDFIKSRIFTIHGVQVMLSNDLASLYDVEVKYLHRQVKRNENRFPSDFVLHLSPDETKALRCQNVTSKRGGDRYGVLAFTEQGIAMLSSVLRSPTAIEVNIRIMRAFSAMRRFLLANAQVFQRIEVVEKRQIATDAKVDSILERLDAAETPIQGVFYDGQLWDARALVLKLIQSAKRSLVLIDNWATAETLDLFAKKRKGVRLAIFTSEHYDKKHMPHHKISPADVATFNAQYPKLAVRYNETFHDRFLIIDNKELYLSGASLKDLGRKCFAFTKLDAGEISRIKKSAFRAHRSPPHPPTIT